eukprot:GHVU01138907.1.p1 GENE.GHVU01138907.1~~GHVU01138907.1.p1  ORF type:complete len:219 (+),score=14.26 GHVU01138907.1:528-1184(+)
MQSCEAKLEANRRGASVAVPRPPSVHPRDRGSPNDTVVTSKNGSPASALQFVHSRHLCDSSNNSRFTIGRTEQQLPDRRAEQQLPDRHAEQQLPDGRAKLQLPAGRVKRQTILSLADWELPAERGEREAPRGLAERTAPRGSAERQVHEGRVTRHYHTKIMSHSSTARTSEESVQPSKNQQRPVLLPRSGPYYGEVPSIFTNYRYLERMFWRIDKRRT